VQVTARTTLAKGARSGERNKNTVLWSQGFLMIAVGRWEAIRMSEVAK